MRTERQPHQMMVGDRAHRIIAATLVEGVQLERRARALQVIRHARAVFQEHPVDYRPREALVDAVTAAGVYLEAHERSNSRKRNGWFKDLRKNLARAGRRGAKKLFRGR